VDSRIEDGHDPDLEDYARAERLLEELRVRQPGNMSYCSLLMLVRLEWADELEARGRADEARACRERAGSGSRGEGAALFEAAVAAADTARSTGTYPTRVDATRVRARREQLLRRAVSLIERAIAEGFGDAAKLHRTALLAVVADDPEYRSVVAALDDRVFPAEPFASRP
jgi:hypothetical protein